MKAIVTGSFDPFTLGHLEIVKYALTKYDTVYVVALNNEEKSYMFSLEERKRIIELSVLGLNNVIVDAYTGLTADYMNERGITHIVRGVRNEQDRAYEICLANKMKEFNPKFETELVECSDEFKEISSTEARKKIENNQSLNHILHKNVIDKRKKCKK
ncbi:MAG: pantetheine-phosphate adenylyltransferase [Ruminococcaceae bacterium]|nr:pantetheine-phosphate adenylyltransferase [Oscillospiraceae bacterium]